MSGALPNAVVIGAQKCGTTALHDYLALHPEVSASKPKELDFFAEDGNLTRGIDWYRSHFDPEKPVRVESSPNYTTWPRRKGIAERMAAAIPDAKLIFMVRDPIARIEAQWVHNYAERREPAAPTEVVAQTSTSYVMRSRYFMQLERFLALYDRSQLLVLEQSDLRDRRSETLRAAFSFLEIDPDFRHEGFDRAPAQTTEMSRPTVPGRGVRRLRTAANGLVPDRLWSRMETELRLSRPVVRPNLRDRIPADVLSVLREDALELRKLTGREFADWSVLN